MVVGLVVVGVITVRITISVLVQYLYQVSHIALINNNFVPEVVGATIGTLRGYDWKFTGLRSALSGATIGSLDN